MQKLIYENLLGASVEFARAAPYILKRVTGLSATDVELQNLRGAYQHGYTLVAARHAERHVDVTMHIQGGNPQELYQNRAALAALLSIGRAMDGDSLAKLYYINDAGTWWTWAHPDGDIPDGTRVAGRYLTDVRLSFVCPSPYWYSADEQTAAFAYNGEGLTFPSASFPFTFGRRDYSRVAQNGGQVDAPVEVWIIGKGETPSLLNVDTGARLKLTTALANGYILHVNTDPAKLEATITNTAGVQSSAFGLLDISNPVTDFRLRAGNNRLLYEPGGASARSEITVKWYNAYEGV